MAEYAADDMTFIARRLKEIQDEMKKALERPAEEPEKKETPAEPASQYDDYYGGY